MPILLPDLTALPLFRRSSPGDLGPSLPLWSEVTLNPGQLLFAQGEPAHSLAILLSGELAAEVGTVEVGRVAAGELIGEAAAFLPGELRIATVKARKASRLALLPRQALGALRAQRSPVFLALIEAATLTLARRVRATNSRIAAAAQGEVAAPARTEPSALARLWRALKPGGPSGSCPPIEPLLRQQPGLGDVPAEVLAEIAAVFTPMPMQEGAVLFLEGESGSSAALVADGEVDVLRNVRGNKAERLTTLKPGAAFGINAIVERAPRTASCVATSSGWLYQLEAEALGKLRGEARAHWQESVLAVLASQIRNANAVLRRTTVGDEVAAPAAAKADDFSALLKASGYLESLPVHEQDLERVSVTYTEDDRRNWKGQRERA